MMKQVLFIAVGVAACLVPAATQFAANTGPEWMLTANGEPSDWVSATGAMLTAFCCVLTFLAFIDWTDD
jgi:hypothetical protein